MRHCADPQIRGSASVSSGQSDTTRRRKHEECDGATSYRDTPHHERVYGEIYSGQHSRQEQRMAFRHDPLMGEISGLGGDYEQTCQDMLEAGVSWLVSNPDLAAQLVTEDSEGQRLLAAEDHPARQSLGEAITAAGHLNTSNSQYGAVLRRVAWISFNSWDAYVEKLRQRKSRADD